MSPISKRVLNPSKQLEERGILPPSNGWIWDCLWNRAGRTRDGQEDTLGGVVTLEQILRLDQCMYSS